MCATSIFGILFSYETELIERPSLPFAGDVIRANSRAAINHCHETRARAQRVIRFFAFLFLFLGEIDRSFVYKISRSITVANNRLYAIVVRLFVGACEIAIIETARAL